MRKLNIPNNVRSIGNAFSLSGIENINLPNGIQKIEANTFWSCESLTQINIPESVKMIGETAFENCTQLNKVFLNEGLESIRGAAFCDCPQLQEITIPKSVMDIGADVFAITEIYRPDLRYNPQTVYLKHPKIIIKCWTGTHAQTFFRGEYSCRKAE